jgi:hypothetical protein
MLEIYHTLHRELRAKHWKAHADNDFGLETPATGSTPLSSSSNIYPHRTFRNYGSLRNLGPKHEEERGSQVVPTGTNWYQLVPTGTKKRAPPQVVPKGTKR